MTADSIHQSKHQDSTHTHTYTEGERETNVQSMTVSTTSECDQIHLNLVAI